jgi:hypothetical protein
MRPTCDRCKHFAKHPADPINPKAYACLIRAPTAIGVPMQAQMGLTMMIQALYVPLQPGAPACGEFSESDDSKLGKFPPSMQTGAIE